MVQWELNWNRYRSKNSLIVQKSRGWISTRKCRTSATCLKVHHKVLASASRPPSTPPTSIFSLSVYITAFTSLLESALARFFKKSKANSVDMTSREATHAGSWYSANKRELSSQLDGWLKAVPAKTECVGTLSSKQAPVELPSSGARAIIAP